jgi:hypothetical protein
MTSTADVVERFFEYAGTDEADRKLIGRGHSHKIRTYRGDNKTLYSYGQHFPLVQLIMPNGERDEHAWWLCNGDRSSNTTTRHQGWVRNEASRTGLPVAVIPFSALDSAGIERDSIELIEVRPDTHWEEDIECRTWSELPKYQQYRGTYVDPESGKEAQIPSGLGWREAQEWYARHEHRQVPVEPDEDGVYRYTVYRHRLGDCLFKARYRERGADVSVKEALFLSSFDYQESRPLYFLAQLPDDLEEIPTTVEQAFECLKPVSVQKADLIDLPYCRQGDIFAIESTLTRRDLKAMGARFAKRSSGGFDTWVKKNHTPDDAERIRQGAFAGYGTENYEFYLVQWRRFIDETDRNRKEAQLLGTNHVATEAAILPDGSVYARGCLYHEPGTWRLPDHARRRMGDGKTWHLIEKNTVPHSHGARAWTIGGGVD